jgi:chromosome segregation ATPase
MAAIRERSPSEIYLEKKLLNCLPTNTETPVQLFNYFKSKAKEMINYHLDKPKKPRKTSKENQENYEETPPKFNYKKKPKALKVKDSLESEPSDDFKRLKEMIIKRAYVIENVASLISNQKKSLNSIKGQTNREQLFKQIDEIEDSNNNVLNELETLLLSLHDAMRQADKISQISAFEKNNQSKELNVSFQETLNKERKKYETQIAALQELNYKLSSLPKASDVEKEYNKKINDLQNKLNFHQDSLSEKTDSIKKKHQEINELLVSISEKNKEIENLQDTQKNLSDFIKSQEESSEREISVLKSEISKLERLLKENSSALENSLRNEINISNQSIQSKDREISRLQLDIGTLEEQLRRQGFEIDTKQRNIFELREEIQKLQDQRKAISKNESQEINYLRQSLEEKERQLINERERISVEIETREKHRIKQKNEWAEIYTGLKHEIKELKQTIIDLNDEKDRRGMYSSIRENEISESQITLKSQVETLKNKLRERDNELKSLWEIVSELQRTDSSKGRIDFNDIKTLIIIKNLEDKAKQRLKKF